MLGDILAPQNTLRWAGKGDYDVRMVSYRPGEGVGQIAPMFHGPSLARVEPP